MKPIIVFVACALLLAVTAVADPWLGDVQTLAADPDHQYEPVEAYNSVHNEYLVSWGGLFTDSNNYGVVGALLDLDAALQGSQFSIFAPSIGVELNYGAPGLAFGAEDHALVAWESARPPDGSVEDIRGRLVGHRLFADGFENGDGGYWLVGP